MGAGAVAVRLFVAPHGELRDMGEHGAAGHMDVHVARPLAAFFPRHEINLADVGNEIRMQNAAVVLGKIFSLFSKELGVAGVEAVLEYVAGVVDKFWIAEQLEGNRLAGQGGTGAGLRAGGWWRGVTG